jgi:hypothetical protein
MKNINKYKTPQDKIAAWRKWANSESGCIICDLNRHDMTAAETYLKEVRNGNDIPRPILLCNKDICFNAWLHSTTDGKN